MNTPALPPSAEPPTPPQRRWHPAWLWLAMVVGLLGLAAIRPLSLPDEGRYAEVGRWMLMSGDWLAPRLDGMPFFHKPPLLHWLQAASFWLFGVNPWAGRLVPALHALLMMAALHTGVRHMGSLALANRATVILGTSLAILIGGQYINHDMMVATWISVAIWCFAVALQHGERPHAALARLGFAACAMGVLSKGLIGLALPGLVLVIWVLWTRQLQRVWRLPWLTGVLIFAALALPWFIAAEHSYPGLMDYLFGNQQFTRYTATGFNNVHPWWFYGVALALLLMPWTWVLPWALVARLRQSRRAQANAKAHAPTAHQTEPNDGQPMAMPRALWTLCWVWLVSITVFFSIPSSKIVGYMLPVMPPLAVLTAWAWQVTMGHRRDTLFRALALAGATLGLVVTLLAVRYTDKNSARDVALELACRASTSDTVLAIDGYPYDLPFYAQVPKALKVVLDWEKARTEAGDDWRRELFESAHFDPEAAQALLPPEALAEAVRHPHTWLLAPSSLDVDDPRLVGWQLSAPGQRWSLWASMASTPEGPEAAERKSLPGCDH
jgi:4-amino-4-deoxy-L-arabinose transferase-like glycosyltransferase